MGQVERHMLACRKASGFCHHECWPSASMQRGKACGQQHRAQQHTQSQALATGKCCVGHCVALTDSDNQNPKERRSPFW